MSSAKERRQLQQNPPVLHCIPWPSKKNAPNVCVNLATNQTVTNDDKWRCRRTQADRYDGGKTVLFGVRYAHRYSFWPISVHYWNYLRLQNSTSEYNWRVYCTGRVNFLLSSLQRYSTERKLTAMTTNHSDALQTVSKQCKVKQKEKVWRSRCKHQAVADEVLERSLAIQCSRQHEQSVEPSAGLIDAFSDEITREAFLELLPILKRVVVLCVRHAATLKPAVEDLRHAS